MSWIFVRGSCINALVHCSSQRLLSVNACAPVLVALAICQSDIWILAHHRTRGIIHQLECTFVIRLLKPMRLRKSAHPPRCQSSVERPSFTAKVAYRWNPCPSTLTTRNVLGSRLSANSYFFTYAYFEPAILFESSKRGSKARSINFD